MKAVKFSAVSVMFLLACVTAHADSATSLAKCRSEADSLKRLTCYDAIEVSGKETVAETPAVAPKSASPIILVNARLRARDKDPRKGIYSPRVELIPSFRNESSKTVVAIEHSLVITDAFGEKVVDGSSKLDIKIAPGKTAESDSYYLWEDNPFISGEPYDRLYGPVSTGVAKASLSVTKAVFSDGTVESYQ